MAEIIVSVGDIEIVSLISRTSAGQLVLEAGDTLRTFSQRKSGLTSKCRGQM
jgi:hypothetical protein